MRMRRKWLLFLARCAPGRVGEAHFRHLDALYSQPDRHYHDWRHVLACLRALQSLSSRCGDPLTLEMAVWFHDAVYDPRRQDNERKSARLARRAGGELGLSPGFLRAVERLILLTDHRAPPPAETDAGLLRDIDLAVLGGSPGRYAAYAAAIRREYGFVPEGEYRERRGRFLKSLLGRPSLYGDARFRRRYEHRARRNLKAELARLGRLPEAPGGHPPGRGPGR